MSGRLRQSLGSMALLGLVIGGCSSASAADGEHKASAKRSAIAVSAEPTVPSLPAAAPPRAHKGPPLPASSASGSGEPIGSYALEHRLDKLEKEIQSSEP